MAQYIDKSTLVAELERRMDELYDLLPDSNGIIDGSITISTKDACNTGKYTALESFRKYVDTLEVIEIGVDVGSPEGDLGRKTVQVIDADGNISEVTFNKTQKGE